LDKGFLFDILKNYRNSPDNFEVLSMIGYCDVDEKRMMVGNGKIERPGMVIQSLANDTNLVIKDTEDNLFIVDDIEPGLMVVRNDFRWEKGTDISDILNNTISRIKMRGNKMAVLLGIEDKCIWCEGSLKGK